MTTYASKVLLDDGTGTYPYDISAKVKAWTFGRGRQDEMTQPDTGTASVTLDNTEGYFTIGNPTYGFVLGQGIRILVNNGLVTNYPRFTGVVDTAPLTWTASNGLASEVVVSCTDVFAQLSRRTLKSMLEEEVLLDDPLVYYTMGDPAGAGSAVDSSGNAGPSLTVRGSGAAPVFGNATGPGTDGLTAVQFNGGQRLSASFTALANYMVPSSIELWINTTMAPSSAVSVLSVEDATRASIFDVSMSASGEVTAFGGTMTSGTRINDGATHHVAVAMAPLSGSSLAFSLYVDGALVSSATGGNGGAATPAYIEVGGGPHSADPVLTGTMSHVAVYDHALTATRVAAHYAAGHGGFAGLTSMQGIAKVADWAGIPAGARSLSTSPALTSMADMSISGTSALAAMQSIAEAEGGVVFIDGAGRLTATARTADVLNATGTPGLTLSAAAAAADGPEDDLTFPNDRQYLYNLITGGMTNGSSQLVQDAASRAKYGDYEQQIDAPFASDADALNAMQWTLAKHKTPDPARISTASVDLATATAATILAVLSLDLTMRFDITDLPVQSPAGSAPQIVEGISESWDNTGTWTWTANAAPAALGQAWVLGDSTYGVLGSTTQLYY